VLFATLYNEVCSEKLKKDYITLTDQRLLTTHTVLKTSSAILKLFNYNNN